jgi:hypothetical protein
MESQFSQSSKAARFRMKSRVAMSVEIHRANGAVGHAVDDHAPKSKKSNAVSSQHVRGGK